MATVEEVLEEFDQKTEPFREVEVHSGLRQNEEPESDEEEFKLKAEKMAFSFTENYPDEHNRWGTYYGPMMTGPTEDGRYFESPSINHVDEDVLDYWDERAEETTHPLLKIRYHDLIWDFSKKTIEDNPNVEHAIEVVNATLDLFDKELYKTLHEGKVKLERALSIAIQINHEDLIEQVIERILNFDQRSGNEVNAYSTLAYDNLVDEHDELISAEDERDIIDKLERDYNQAINGEREVTSTHITKQIAIKLANYFQNQDQIEKARNIIKKYGDSVLQRIEEEDSALIAYSDLSELYEVYMNYGLSEEAHALNSKMTEVAELEKQQLQKFEHTFEIDKEKVEELYSHILSGNLHEIFEKIISNFIPRKDQVEQQVQDIAEEAPLIYHIPKSIQDHAGRMVAKIGSIREDFEGRTVDLMRDNLYFEVPFLNEAFRRLIEQKELEVNDFVGHLMQSPIFNEQNEKYLRVAFQNYLNENYPEAIHLFVFQIEKVLRNLISQSGGAIYSRNDYGGFNLKTMGSLLNDAILSEVYGENVIFYLKTLLIDPRGWNIRNKVGHGFMLFEKLNQSVSNRLIHVLLILSLVRYREDTD